MNTYKLLSVGIAVFKPLHVWSSKEATGNEEKKIAEPEVGKCQFEHWLGTGSRRAGAQAGSRAGAQAGAGCVGRAGAGLGERGAQVGPRYGGASAGR